jgi:hypothetical protein
VLCRIKKDKMMSLAGQRVEPEIMLSKISQMQKDKYQMFSLMWNLDLKKEDMKVEEKLFGKRKGITGKGEGGHDQSTL